MNLFAHNYYCILSHDSYNGTVPPCSACMKYMIIIIKLITCSLQLCIRMVIIGLAMVLRAKGTTVVLLVKQLQLVSWSMWSLRSRLLKLHALHSMQASHHMHTHSCRTYISWMSSEWGFLWIFYFRQAQFCLKISQTVCMCMGYHCRNHAAAGEVLVHWPCDLYHYSSFGETLLTSSRVVDTYLLFIYIHT